MSSFILVELQLEKDNKFKTQKTLMKYHLLSFYVDFKGKLKFKG